ncbi:MAG: hypothetical protein K2N88_06955 [Muribaculaceae bacterium]|nr:hypothetical protein [Muribaculaceae bacterium]
MTLTEQLTRLVDEYIDNFDRFDSYPQIRINPANLTATLVNGSDMLTAIADNDEALEDATAAQGDETEAASEYQVKQNPDFYAVKKLLKTTPAGATKPDEAAIRTIAAYYSE